MSVPGSLPGPGCAHTRPYVRIIREGEFFTKKAWFVLMCPDCGAQLDKTKAPSTFHTPRYIEGGNR